MASDTPSLHNELLLLRAASAAAVEVVAGRTVNRQREQVLRFCKVGDQTGTHDEVAETEEVDGKDENQDHVEDVLPALCVARRILLRDHRRVESLKEAWPFLDEVARKLIGILVPVVAEGRVDSANHDERAGVDGEGLGHGRVGGRHLWFVKSELGEDASVGGVVVNRTTIKVHGQSPLIGEPLPVKRGKRPALVSRERSTICVLICVILTVGIHTSTCSTRNTKLGRTVGRNPGSKLAESIVLAFSALA
ncbi:hypothetical protein HG531_007503 [Fusarium graminearum]|nr:hypothetical protein HG531_007503 [Fusarium graminearum]